eukprot:285852_1
MGCQNCCPKNAVRRETLDQNEFINNQISIRNQQQNKYSNAKPKSISLDYENIPDIEKTMTLVIERIELLAHGYFGHNNKQLVPLEIIYICISYIGNTDQWDKYSSNWEAFTFLPNKGLLSGNRSFFDNDKASVKIWKNAFGTMVVKAGYTTIWTLRILNKNPNIFIGICNEIKCTKNMFDRFDGIGNNGYALSLKEGYIYHYGKKKEYLTDTNSIGYNDVITMELNLLYGRLKYYINDRDCGEAYSNIRSEKCSYKLAVAMIQPDAIQLM